MPCFENVTFVIPAIEHHRRCVYLFFFLYSKARQKETQDQDCIPKAFGESAPTYVYENEAAKSGADATNNARLPIWLC